MPRRKKPDPLAKRIGARIRELREEKGLTMEQLAYQTERGERRYGSKGFLSDVERGLARPTVETLAALAERLEVKLLDLVTFPDEDERALLVDRSRGLTKGALRKLLRDTSPPTKK